MADVYSKTIGIELAFSDDAMEYIRKHLGEDVDLEELSEFVPELKDVM